MRNKRPKLIRERVERQVLKYERRIQQMKERHYRLKQVLEQLTQQAVSVGV